MREVLEAAARAGAGAGPAAGGAAGVVQAAAAGMAAQGPLDTFAEMLALDHLGALFHGGPQRHYEGSYEPAVNGQ